MIGTKTFTEKAHKLQRLELNSIFDNLQDKDFDDIVIVASGICGVSPSSVILIDNKHQSFKSHSYSDIHKELEPLLFMRAIGDSKKVFQIEDIRIDKRFSNIPSLEVNLPIIFLAGVPIIDNSGDHIGTIVVIDNHAQVLGDNQIVALQSLCNQALDLLELRRDNILLQDKLVTLKEKNQDMEDFACLAAHDLRSPLNNIDGLINIFAQEYNPLIDDEGKKILGFIKKSANNLKLLVDGLLDYSKSEVFFKGHMSSVDLETLRNELLSFFSMETGLEIVLNSTSKEIYANRIVIMQILINLLDNAIKYNDKKEVKIKIDIMEDDDFYEFSFLDNGPGIPVEYHHSIFKIFEVLEAKDKYGRSGNGIGLATVWKLVDKSKGIIKVESEMGKNTKFIFTIKK